MIFSKPFPFVLKVVGREVYLILKDDAFFVIPIGQASKMFSFLKSFFKSTEYKYALKGRMFTAKDLKDDTHRKKRIGRL